MQLCVRLCGDRGRTASATDERETIAATQRQYSEHGSLDPYILGGDKEAGQE